MEERESEGDGGALGELIKGRGLVELGEAVMRHLGGAKASLGLYCEYSRFNSWQMARLPGCLGQLTIPVESTAAAGQVQGKCLVL